MKMPVELLNKAEAEYPKSAAEITTIRAENASESAITLDGLAHVDLRREMISATATEDVADAFERYIGSNDLLPINYLLSGYLHGRAVGRVKYFDKREGKTATATGFMISPTLLMTNHHVFPVADLPSFQTLVEDPTIEFGYEFDLDGVLTEPVVYELDPATFLYTNENLDLALVAVRPTDRGGSHQIKEQGYLVLNGRIGKAGLGDFATIIQHPAGREKQISLRNNEIIDTSHPDAIIYASDTAPGSSGAPVFNNEWQIIALHSAGVPKRNDAGDYVDKNDQVIEVINGKVDADRVVWVSNRGIRVSAIMAHLSAAGTAVSLSPQVQALFSPAYTDSRPFGHLSRPVLPMEKLVDAPTSAPLVREEVPAAPVTIQITIGGGGGPLVTTSTGTRSSVVSGAEEEEKQFEDDQDFSSCEGFQEDFMGVRIPMPAPNASLRKKLAYRTDSPSSYLLKYHHFSTIHHAVRRVPVVSAINVHGKYRYDALGKESRKDKWYRDNRIDYDVQLDDAWYAKSGFDKGHMTRREDAEWGQTMAAAKLAADMTCSYANAIPQVPALNRAIYGYHGLWGQLEGKLLEAGVTDESGKSARICVFSGPIFDDDDRTFKGVQVAVTCFKVVAWYDGDGELRTTCFRLSQKELVGEIEFEVLHFDEVFKTYQCPLTEIEAATGLTFSDVMRQSDTTSGATEELTEGTFERLLKDKAARPR
jgi:endonuclease G